MSKYFIQLLVQCFGHILIPITIIPKKCRHFSLQSIQMNTKVSLKITTIKHQMKSRLRWMTNGEWKHIMPTWRLTSILNVLLLCTLMERSRTRKGSV